MKWKHCFLLKCASQVCFTSLSVRSSLARAVNKIKFWEIMVLRLTPTSPSLHRLSKRDNFVKSHPILFAGVSGQEGNPLYLFLTASLRKPDILDFTAD